MMADCSNSTDTQVLHFDHSQSPPPPVLGWEKKKVIDQLFEDTVPLDDSVSLGSSFDGTQLVTYDSDTRVVDDSDCVEDVRMPQQITEYEEEVVLDSEDEERSSDVKAVGRKEGNVVEAFDGSIAGEHCGTGAKEALMIDESADAVKNHPQILMHNQVFTELNYICSEETSESSQANALDFVNHYLSLNNVHSTPGTVPRNVIRKKVSPVARIKGCQSLAEKIQTRTLVGKDDTFEWVDGDHCGRIDFFSKRMSVTFDHGNSQQSVKRHQKVGHVENKEASSLDNKLKGKCIDLNKEVLVSPCSDSRPSVHSSKGISRFKQASEMNFENDCVRNSSEQFNEVQLGQDSDSYTIDRNASDTFDVGFGTQMAAEAMEALSCGVPKDSCVDNVNQGPSNFLLDPSPGVTKSKIHFKKPCLQKDMLSNQECISRMSKQRDSYAGSSHNESEITRRKRTKYSSGRLNRMNNAYQNELSGRKYAKPVEKRKEGSTAGNESTKESEDCGSSSIPFGNILLRKQCILGESVAHQTGRWITGGKLEGKKDRSDNLGERMIDIAKSGILFTYKRKRSTLGAKPSQILNVGGKCTEGKKFTHQRHWMKGDELEETIDGPDCIGKRMNDITKGNIITYTRKRSAKALEVMSTEGKGTELSSNIPEVLRNNKTTQQTQGCLEVSPITSSFIFNAWSFPRRKRMPRRRPSQSNEADKQSTPFIKSDGKEGCKKPYNKIIPKSSLLKELIRLGIQETKPDSAWKDFRKRRDVSHFQVLFSQHLDDDIIKQQKKIMTRLGISIASCSMNATHFIADTFVRTRNMLEAIALGKPVVTHLWLESCGQANCLIDEKNYILRDAKREREIGFSMPASLARANQHPLLKGQRVLITPNIKPDKEMITGLIKAVHGQVVEKIQSCSLKIPDDLLILSCEEDHCVCVPFLDKGAAVYSSELLLNGIVIQRLEYERHQIFTNRAKRNGRSKIR